MVFHLTRPLEATRINAGLVDLPDIRSRVIAFVRAACVQNVRAEEGRMFGDGPLFSAKSGRLGSGRVP